MAVNWKGNIVATGGGRCHLYGEATSSGVGLPRRIETSGGRRKQYRRPIAILIYSHPPKVITFGWS